MWDKEGNFLADRQEDIIAASTEERGAPRLYEAATIHTTQGRRSGAATGGFGRLDGLGGGTRGAEALRSYIRRMELVVFTLVHAVRTTTAKSAARSVHSYTRPTGRHFPQTLPARMSQDRGELLRSRAQRLLQRPSVPQGRTSSQGHWQL